MSEIIDNPNMVVEWCWNINRAAGPVINAAIGKFGDFVAGGWLAALNI